MEVLQCPYDMQRLLLLAFKHTHIITCLVAFDISDRPLNKTSFLKCNNTAGTQVDTHWSNLRQYPDDP